MKELIAGILIGAFLATVGITCVLYPERIQEYALRGEPERGGIASFNPLRKWVKSSNYILTMRIIGALAICASLIVFYAILRGK